MNIMSRSSSGGISCGMFTTPATVSSKSSRTLSSRLTTPSVAASSRLTSGSRRTPYATSINTPGETSTTFVALVEGRGMAKGEIGIASIDLKMPVLILSQFSDSQVYVKTLHKLQILQPSEIVLPVTAYESGSMSKLAQEVTDRYQNVNIATVQRKYFNELKGLEYIKQLCVSDFSAVEMEIRTKYYCLAATAALLKYVEFIQNIFYAPGSIKVVFKGSEETTMIDVSTSVNLELLQNNRDVKSSHTLFGILNSTKTTMGARLLRSNILQPPNDLHTIAMRHSTVQELIEKSEMFFSIQSVISRFIDIDHLLSGCAQVAKEETLKTAEQRITNMIYLKHVVELIDHLKSALEQAVSPLLRTYYNKLNDKRFGIIKILIDKVIHEDATYQKNLAFQRSQKCFAVKANINGLLDISRKVYTELLDSIGDIIQKLSDEHQLPIKTAYNVNRGYHMQIHCGTKNTAHISESSLPNVFIKVSKTRNTLSFTTLDLIKQNERIKLAVQEIYMMTNLVVTELLNNIRQHFGCFYELSEYVSMLDMLVSFAHNCSTNNYVQPVFSESLAIKQGRHPILDKKACETPVPNNIYASQESNFIVITGPNMSGKSTYLRQIALLQIMAQIGSYVPAEFASFRLADQIFSRIGSDDDIETNSSTFMLEMKEINYILQNVSSRSLIIIDELGRGTSADEGIGLCHAICEKLLGLKVFTFFATHFLEIAKLSDIYHNVENYHFEIQRRKTISAANSKKENIVFTHVLTKGSTEECSYGIHLAEMSSLPREVVEKARILSQKLNQEKSLTTGASADILEKRAIFKVSKHLIQVANNSKLDSESLRTYLERVRAQHVDHMKAIQACGVEN